MKRTKVLLALGLVMALLISPLAATNNGADVIIIKIDKTKIKGELIAVKPNSILILESGSGADISTNIEDISRIQILKKSRGNGLLGAALGFAAGGGVGILLGGALTPSKPGFMGEWDHDLACIGDFILGGLTGAVIGGGIGGSIGGRDEFYVIAGISPDDIKIILEKIRLKARIPNYK